MSCRTRSSGTGGEGGAGSGGDGVTCRAKAGSTASNTTRSKGAATRSTLRKRTAESGGYATGRGLINSRLLLRPRSLEPRFLDGLVSRSSGMRDLEGETHMAGVGTPAGESE